MTAGVQVSRCHFTNRLATMSTVSNRYTTDEEPLGDPWPAWELAQSANGMTRNWLMRRNLPIKRDNMSRTAGSGEPKDSDRLCNKGAAIFPLGGNVSSWRFRKVYRFGTDVHNGTQRDLKRPSRLRSYTSSEVMLWDSPPISTLFLLPRHPCRTFIGIFTTRVSRRDGFLLSGATMINHGTKKKLWKFATMWPNGGTTSNSALDSKHKTRSSVIKEHTEHAFFHFHFTSLTHDVNITEKFQFDLNIFVL